MLLRSIAALGAERERLPFETEVLVLDNGSDDGSADAVRGLGGDIELIEIAQRRSKAVNDSELMERSRGRYCLLLNEDSELLPGASAALYAALEADPRAACAVAAAEAAGWRGAAFGLAVPRRGYRAFAGALPASLARRAEQGVRRAAR
jgi:GT2 family glycosyltransferase